MKTKLIKTENGNLYNLFVTLELGSPATYYNIILKISESIDDGLSWHSILEYDDNLTFNIGSGITENSIDAILDSNELLHIVYSVWDDVTDVSGGVPTDGIIYYRTYDFDLKAITNGSPSISYSGHNPSINIDKSTSPEEIIFVSEKI